MGAFAVFLLFLGAGYVVLRRGFVYVTSLKGEENLELRQTVIDLYRKFKKPLLYIHNVTLFTATIAGAIHGILWWRRWGFGEITGTIAWSVMVLLSLFGIVLFFRFKVLMDNKRTRRALRFIHRQWILSVIMIIFLALHLAAGE